MAEAGSTALIELMGLTLKNKIAVIQASPASTTDTVTLNATNFIALTGYNAIVTATAYETSNAVSKNISNNGSTILTTQGWTLGDGPWLITVLLRNDTGQIGNA